MKSSYFCRTIFLINIKIYEGEGRSGNICRAFPGCGGDPMGLKTIFSLLLTIFSTIESFESSIENLIFKVENSQLFNFSAFMRVGG